MPKSVWLILINSFCLFVWFFNLSSQNLDLSTVRDPFLSEIKNEYIETIHQAAPINLLGIVKLDKTFGAILEKEGIQETVFVNEGVWDCVVKDISANFVVLLKGGKQIKLFFK